MTNLATFIFLMVFSTVAFACTSPPSEQTVSQDELISRTRIIVLARAVSAQYANGSVNYKFEVIKSVKGRSNKNFEIKGAPLLERGLNSFNHHNDPAFWEATYGRVYNYEDCKIYPGFSVGETFLVFLDKPYHRKSFEYIIRTHGNTKDKWLTYVEIKSRNAP